MHRSILNAALLICLCLFFSACATTGKTYRPGRDVRADLGKKGSAKFILGIGQRGFLDIDGNSYGFELSRIDTMDNIAIELLSTGKTINLSAQMLKKVSLAVDGPQVTFEFSSMVRGAAIIYVYADRTQPTPEPVIAPTSKPTPGTEKIRIHLKTLDNTAVTLALDNGDSQEIPLPKGTEVSWEATQQAEITLQQASKAVLEINGVTYRPAQGAESLHIMVMLQDGRLVVENR